MCVHWMGCAETKNSVSDSTEKYAPTVNEVQGSLLASWLVNMR